MTSVQPTGDLDRRFSDPASAPTPWAETERLLQQAELYWLTTVRADGRPHVTPLIGVHHDGALHFCTGLGEQKARNLERSPHVALATGTNTWAAGTDVVVEGSVLRVTNHEMLVALAEAYVAKYGESWRFAVQDGTFDGGGGPAAVFRVTPSKILTFAKQPHGQTTYRFGGGA